MSRKSRVRKIMVSLTPKQAATDYVTRMQRFESHAKFCASPPDHWEIFSPLEELAAQVEDAVEAALPEADDRELKKAVRAAVQEVIYLVYLHHHVISLVAQEERVLVILAELASDKLSLVISSSARKPAQGWDDEMILRTRWEGLIETTKSLALLFYDISETVKSIEDASFDGLTILFEDSRNVLEYVGAQLTEVVELMNILALERPMDSPIDDLDKLRDVARQKSEQRRSNLIDMAKSDALFYLGDRSGAKRGILRISERLNSRGSETFGS